WLWRVLVQRAMCSGTVIAVIVDEVLAQQATQMGFAQHHDVVEALAAERADETFHVWILPRRSRRRRDFVDPHGLRAPRERDPVHRIAIAQGIAGQSVRGTPPRAAGPSIGRWGVG